MSVDLNVANRDLLSEALDAAGYRYVVLGNGNVAVNTDAGQIILGDKQATLPQQALSHLNTIKRGYSRQTLRHVAKKYKLTLTEREDGHVVLRGY